MVREHNMHMKTLGILQPRCKDENTSLIALQHTELTRFLILSQLPFLAKDSDTFTSRQPALPHLRQLATLPTRGAVGKRAPAKGASGWSSPHCLR